MSKERYLTVSDTVRPIPPFNIVNCVSTWGYAMALSVACMSLAEIVDYDVTTVQNWSIIVTSFFGFSAVVVGAVLYQRMQTSQYDHNEEHYVPMEIFAANYFFIFAFATGLIWSFDSSYSSEQISLFDHSRSLYTDNAGYNITLYVRWKIVHLFILANLPLLSTTWWRAFRRHFFGIIRPDAAFKYSSVSNR